MTTSFFNLLLGLLFGISITCIPIVFWVALTVYLFNKSKKLEIITKPNNISLILLYGGLISSVIIIILNILVVCEIIVSSVVFLMWIITVINIIFGWILPLVLLLYLKDKGLQYRKWIILYWVLNFMIFLTGICNPIPQSV